MTAAPGNQKGAAGETTFALRLGGHRARQNKRITLFDADRQRLALLSLEQRAGKRQERLFAVIGLTQAALCREAPEHALLADDITQSAPLDSRASTGVSGRVAETRVFRATLFAHVALRQRAARSLIARAAARNPANHDSQASASRVGQRVIFAKAARSAQLEQRGTAPRRPSSTRDSGTRRGDRKIGAATAQERNSAFAARPSDAARARSRRRENVGDPARHGRPAGAPRPEQRRSLAVRGPRGPLTCEFPESN
jgi:hypothetical protein